MGTTWGVPVLDGAVFAAFCASKICASHWTMRCFTAARFSRSVLGVPRSSFCSLASSSFRACLCPAGELCTAQLASAPGGAWAGLTTAPAAVPEGCTGALFDGVVCNAGVVCPGGAVAVAFVVGVVGAL